MTITTPLEAGCFYHIYNRGNNSELIFREPANYHYFLKLMQKYISPSVDIYAYCLLNNHFHLLVKIRQETFNLLGKINKPEQNFSNFFNAYAKSFNQKYKRTGKLFEERFKRKRIEDEFYFTEVLYYIHANPQNHKIIKDFRNYKYSSYQNLLSCTEPNLIQEEIFDWFGGEELFKQYHADKQKVLAEVAFFDV
ncbi:transposase [Pedobacter sp. Du54]|uniref:transposase n=1 Tax=Pedobacter anseongensis TaxID=3133439 RepID=UPI003096038A